MLVAMRDGVVWTFPLHFLSPYLWETPRYRLKYSLKGPLNQNQPTNQINLSARLRRMVLAFAVLKVLLKTLFASHIFSAAF